jgi:ankyrin repeat protein
MLRFLLIFLCLANYSLAQNIFDLARNGTVKQMQAHLKKHPDELHLISEHGASPFLLAAYRGNNEVAKLLLQKGADIQYCYSEGSAIYALIYKNNLELLDMLLQKGVNPNDTCQFEQMGYPLHFALSLQRLEVIRLLLQYNLDLSVQDPQGRSLEQLLTLYNNPKLNELIHTHEK